MPLIKGQSKQIISENVRTLTGQGVPEAKAVSMAKQYSLGSYDPVERHMAVRQSVQAQHRRVGDDPNEFASDDIELPNESGTTDPRLGKEVHVHIHTDR